MKHTLLAAALAICLAAGPAAAAPGDPFGGAETGCVPSGKPGLTCGKILNTALAKLVSGILKCHIAQASSAFKAGASSPAIDTAEETCSVTGLKSVKAKFDAAVVKAVSVCPVGIVPVAEARRDAFLADAMGSSSLDAVNQVFFCDSTSGLSVSDPGGGDQDELGSIPATSDNYKCSIGVMKAFSKLAASTYKCHVKAAQAIFADKPFDTDAACEETPVKGAHAKYDAAVNKLVAAGICPSCMSDPMSPASSLGIGTAVLSALDAQNEEIYPCPAP
jgi:hypothetical protein